MYNNPLSINNLLVAQYDLLQLANDVKKITGNQTAYNIFKRSLGKVLKNPISLAKLLLNSTNPVGFLQTIALETNDISQFKKISTIGNDLPVELNEIRANVKPFGSRVTTQVYNPEISTEIPIWEEDTIERRQRNENRITIVNAFRMVGLIGMYETAARSTYTTTEEIEEIKEMLNQYYEKLVENDTTKYIIGQVKNNIDIVKTRAEIVLNEKEQNTPRIITIKLERPYSAKQICYELYGELIKNEIQLNTFANIITGLNRSKVAHAMSGEIKVIEK